MCVCVLKFPKEDKFRREAEVESILCLQTKTQLCARPPVWCWCDDASNGKEGPNQQKDENNGQCWKKMSSNERHVRSRMHVCSA